ncbi:OmpA family protein [Chryseobacterium carnipullorum]|uniref:OmpA family protein n=1 Tax=Chryseobacterium carnipullorum TaxID=1124835 RepID=UPI0021CF9B07|nr:OmpA family protein [Chryseobacterium carnipullorum]
MEGYTDKTGDEAKNLKLSQERANFIKAELSKLGATAQIVSAEGYGSQFAHVDAKASDSERASDRKMSVRFTK